MTQDEHGTNSLSLLPIEETDSHLDDKDDIYMAIEALGKLKNSQPPQSHHPSPSPNNTQLQQEAQVPQETFLNKVTSHPIITTSIKMIEDNKRRWFQEEPQKLQSLKDISLANFNIESRRKLQMMINFLKLGNKQLNLRIEHLSEICEQEKQKKLSLSLEQDDKKDDEDEEEEEEEEFHDAKESMKTTQLNTSHSPSPELHPIDSQNNQQSDQQQKRPQEIKSEIVGTVKKIVKVVSKFTGNSLPEPARSTVRELLLKLPYNWSVQKDLILKDQLDPNGKVLVLAQESLEMIKKILNLCNENLSSLENWNHLKVEEQKYLKEKILIKNHQYCVMEDKIDEKEENDTVEVEDEQLKKRIKIDINDIVNSEENF